MSGFVDLLLGRSTGPTSGMVPRSMPVLEAPYLDGRSVLGLSAVWRCVTLIADTIADMPWQEWRGDELLESSRLVRRPFALRTRRWWTWRMVATEALWNRAYALHVGGTDSAGSPWSLLPVPPSAIQPGLEPDPWGLVFPTSYYVAGREIPAEYLTIVERAPFPDVHDRMSGLLDIARRQFTAYLAADTHMSRYWQAGGPTTTVITSDDEIDDKEAERIAQRWVDRRSAGSDRPAVFGKGAHAEAWGSDPTTESGTEARREINAEIGRYFGVPTRILNAPAGDSETYSNVENDAIDLLRYTLRGYMGPLEDAISEVLPGDYIGGRRMILDPARILQGDLASRSTAWVALTGGERPIFTVDEARRRGFGMPPASSPAIEAPTGATVATIGG